MDTLTSLPQNAAQASTFMSPSSLAFPNSNMNEQLTPPSSEKGKDSEKVGSITNQGAGWQGVSGIVPTLQ